MSTPAYMVVANSLAQELRREKPGAKVATEHEIAARFGLNRLTARAAVQELERRYLVRRVKGQGTYVARRVEYRVGPEGPVGFGETVRAAGAEPRTDLEAIRMRKPPAAVARELGLQPDERTWFVTRLRFVDDELVACADTHVSVDLAPDLPELLRDEGSLTTALQRQHAIDPVRGSYRTEFQLPPERIARRLQVDGRPWMLLSHGRTDCRRSGRPVERSTVWLRADVFSLVVEFGG